MTQSLYIINNNNKIYCITETEKNIYEKILNYKLNVKKVTTEDDLKLCTLQSERKFTHSAYCVNTRRIINKLLSDITYDYIYLSPIDCDVRYTINNIYDYNIYKSDDLVDKVTDKSSNYDLFYYYLKFFLSYDPLTSHIFFIKITCNYNNIIQIQIVDTGSSTISGKLDFEWLKNVISIYFNNKIFFTNKTIVDYPIDRHDIFIQELEVKLVNRGYCVAWVNYFIWKNAILGVPFDDIYEELKSISALDRLLLIIIWWDSLTSYSIDLNDKQYKEIEESKRVYMEVDD